MKAFLIGGGPSAGALDLGRLRGRGFVLAINDCFRKLPWADAVFTADGSWLISRAGLLRDFPGTIVAALPARFTAPELTMTRLLRLDGPGLSPDPEALHYADNSGFGALAWAARGFKEIVLIGYDMDRGGHWHAGYEWREKFVDKYATWAKSFDVIALELERRGVRVINVNPKSAVRCFEFRDFNDVV